MISVFHKIVSSKTVSVVKKKKKNDFFYLYLTIIYVKQNIIFRLYKKCLVLITTLKSVRNISCSQSALIINNHVFEIIFLR